MLNPDYKRLRPGQKVRYALDEATMVIKGFEREGEGPWFANVHWDFDKTESVFQTPAEKLFPVPSEAIH